MVQIKMQNPGPAALMIINPKRRSNNMAARKRSTTRRATVHHRAKPVRRNRKTTRRRSTALTHSRHRNPLFARRRRAVHRNPVSGVISQALPLVGASFVITFVAPIASRLVGSFLPLGQFTQPVVLAGTGYGLGWLSGKLGPTFSKYRGALEIMGVTLGLTALVAPYLRGLLAPSAPPQAQAQAQGMQGQGYRNRRGMNGIAAFPSIPPQIQGAPAAAHAGMNGVASYPMPGRFGF